MTKEQCAAIINAIKETAVYFSQNFIFLRNAVARKNADEDYVDGLTDAYKQNIEDIVDDLPDDADSTPDNTPNDGET